MPARSAIFCAAFVSTGARILRTPRPMAPATLPAPCTAMGSAAPKAAPVAASSGLTAAAVTPPVNAPPAARVAIPARPVRPPALNPLEVIACTTGVDAPRRAATLPSTPPAPAVPKISPPILPPLYIHESGCAPNPCNAESMSARRWRFASSDSPLPFSASLTISTGASNVAPMEPAPRNKPAPALPMPCMTPLSFAGSCLGAGFW